MTNNVMTFIHKPLIFFDDRKIPVTIRKISLTNIGMTFIHEPMIFLDNP